jgi:ubiquinone/menaquinone biosynthesis C-methylase UbiE
MAEMHYLEKLVANSRLYNLLYRHTYLRWFLDFCELKGKCLEIGCGAGFTSMEIAKRFDVRLTAIDYDGEEVEKAKARFRKPGTGNRKPSILQADATALPFKNESFDCAVELSTLHHIAGYRKAVGEVYRVLKKGGRFFIMDEGMYFMWPFSRLLPFDPFEAKFTKDGMIAVLSKAGFVTVRHRGKDTFMIEARKK